MSLHVNTNTTTFAISKHRFRNISLTLRAYPRIHLNHLYQHSFYITFKGYRTYTMFVYMYLELPHLPICPFSPQRYLYRFSNFSWFSVRIAPSSHYFCSTVSSLHWGKKCEAIYTLEKGGGWRRPRPRECMQCIPYKLLFKNCTLNVVVHYFGWGTQHIHVVE